MKTFECTACHHAIDANARLCAFCGADPRTGQKFDPSPLLQESFPRRADLPVHERVLDFFRHRQSIILTAVIVGLFLALVGLHRFVTARAANTVSDVPAIPLSEIADISARSDQQAPLPLPDLPFAYGGSPKTMRTYMMEPGAVAPQTSAPAAQTPQQSPGAAPARPPQQAPVAAPRPATPPQQRPQR